MRQWDARPGTPEHDAIAQKALEARTKLANYIGNTPWVDANKDNPAAIQNADRIIVLHHGRIREIGHHQELLRQKGLYWRLYQLQYKDQLVPSISG